MDFKFHDLRALKEPLIHAAYASRRARGTTDRSRKSHRVEFDVGAHLGGFRTMALPPPPV
jgi:hypothetical protein